MFFKHTHEDIDQGFSVLSGHLRTVDALSSTSYCREVRAAFSHTLDKPDVEYVNVKRDYKNWITAPGILYPQRQGTCAYVHPCQSALIYIRVPTTGILSVRYLRITSYKLAKALVGESLRLEQERLRSDEQTKHQQLLRHTRQQLVDTPADPPTSFTGTGEEYQAVLDALEEKMHAAAAALERVKHQPLPDVPTNIPLALQLEMSDESVVIHYKKHMDDRHMLPTYPEGVVAPCCWG